MYNTHLSQFIPPSAASKSAGTWTGGDASGVAYEARSAADASFSLLIPLALPGSSSYRAGARLKSVDVYYKIATTAADDFATVELYKISLPAASGSALTAAAVTTAIDSAHDAAAERKAAGDHLMTVTLASPAWVDDGDVYALKLTVDAAAGTVFTLYGARALYELRA